MFYIYNLNILFRSKWQRSGRK